MKEIETRGNCYLSLPLYGRGDWYYSKDYPSGDLYEAEEIWKDGKIPSGTSLFLIRYPEGKAVEPIARREGLVLEDPVYCEGYLYLLSVDFTEKTVHIDRFSCDEETLERVAAMPLEEIPDCYNLKLHAAPVMLSRQAGDGTFDILWPERERFSIGNRESFYLRDGEKLFFSSWEEDPEYREEVIVRDLEGRLISRMDGDIWVMPNGEHWHLGGKAK